MVTTIAGKHIEVGDSLQAYIHERLDSGIKKTLNDITQANVTISKKGPFFHVDINIHDRHLGFVKAESESDDVYAAFDTATIKIEKQLRKYKGKISRHIRGIKENNIAQEYIAATKYILDMPVEDLKNEDAEHDPVTIAELNTNIEKLTVSEAVMKMNLTHVPAMLFINKTTNRMNMVYQRPDGNISWVDPKTN